MAGRTGPFRDGRYGGLIYLDCTEDNGFVPDIPRTRVDLIYLCFPNNPTGATISREQLTAWVDYARTSKALILYDAAYVSYIRDPSAARSRSSRSPAPGNAPSSSAASPRPRASPARAARSP